MRIYRTIFVLLIPAIVFTLASCTTTTTTSEVRRQTPPPSGFFDRMLDQVTERECNVGKFTCPFGLGPAGEPCDCTDPSGVVLNGRTVK
jgi:hypothetical protein